MYDSWSIERTIDLWLAEDIGHGDLTAQSMLDPDQTAEFYMNAREELVVAGIDVAASIFGRYDRTLDVKTHVRDGTRVAAGTRLLSVSGCARSVLTAERTALNIVQRLSGIATETARYVAKIEGTGVKLLDSRKTTPGMRMLEKHAVTCGGALNHRLGLDSGVMIKDNHIAVCGSIKAAVARARAMTPVLTKIEVECDRLDQVGDALEAGADVIMLDNMSIADMTEAVRMTAGRAKLEASGGIRLDTIRAIAETGVDYISTSRITQAAPAVDIGLDSPD
ncbi:carboxylating nicotinate-nucleotide diphosphorylase [Trinickia fusca]|uniref:Probable nicotinate-nucleotide pyrophosphorylase [carboxylating] n=1 Tax=Trinickia fusca TaxID=2419777 RepID=A0A494X1D7_9BURK|nr:carboxylating nicotinate-nucleotide diphosphorylase [Trinickia fusca]RKP44152.1 carboxylating nicotinate-nucleotide diphosphorylase [Trinickia fusca]